MRIADQISHVMREFVAFEDLFVALTEEQALKPFQIASWLRRNRDQLDRLPMIECNLELQDFSNLEEGWANDFLWELFAGNGVDWDTDVNPGYRAGWLESDLRRFFTATRVDYPEAAIKRRQQQIPHVRVESSQPEPVVGSEGQGDDTERALGTRERTTLLTVIAALAEEAKITIVSPSKSAEVIAGITERMGTPVAKRTIEEHLKKVPEALDRKSR